MKRLNSTFINNKINKTSHICKNKMYNIICNTLMIIKTILCNSST